MEDVGILYTHLVYFMATWYILWPFGICILLSFGILFTFWYVVQRKILQP
jgi:hypothetical protein